MAKTHHNNYIKLHEMIDLPRLSRYVIRIHNAFIRIHFDKFIISMHFRADIE